MIIFICNFTYLRCLIKIAQCHNKKKIMKVEVKSSQSSVTTPECFFVVKVLRGFFFLHFAHYF